MALRIAAVCAAVGVMSWVLPDFLISSSDSEFSVSEMPFE